MRTVTFDARNLHLYPVGKPGFTGGTEHMVRVLAEHLSQYYCVNVVTPDLEDWEPRGPNLYYWPPDMFPRKSDALVMVQSPFGMDDHTARTVVLATNGIDPLVDGMTNAIDLYPCFSQTHIQMMCQKRPAISPDKCVITGLGVDLQEVIQSEPERGLICYMNDPARGLWHVLDIYEELRKLVPETHLAITYNFELQFSHRKWQQSQMAQVLWECKERIASLPGITVYPELDRPGLLAIQSKQHIHVMPSDPPNQGSQIHGIAQMESASWGTPLVLSDTEAFPEVFGTAADILPLPGAYLEGLNRRTTPYDWAYVTAKIMTDEKFYTEMYLRSIDLARHNSWDIVGERWRDMLEHAIG